MPNIALGTAQWGSCYGIANRSGQAAEGEVRAILSRSFEEGIDTLDTARAYGTSEIVIGRLTTIIGGHSQWRIVTKLAPDTWTDGAGLRHGACAREGKLAEESRALGSDKLDTVLLHRSAHRWCCDGRVWEYLQEQRQAGRIRKLGVSVDKTDQAFGLLADPSVESIQVASSLLDRRLWQDGFFEATVRSKKEIFVRSVFLQGVAFLRPGQLPSKISSLSGALTEIDRFARSIDVSRSDLFLAFAKALPVDHLILGFERAEQLLQALVSWEAVAAITSQAAGLAATLPDLPEHLLDPARWSR